ncbi:MAG: NifU family protein [Acidimicrobiales bacterium]
MTATESHVDLTFEDRARAVDAAVTVVGALESPAARAGMDLKDAIEAFHKPALIRIVQSLKADTRGKELLFELVDDPDVRAVFALHGIIRADPLTRANQALAEVRPYLQSHGGDVELVRIEGRRAVVKLLGSCNGCSMSSVTLREGVEDALVNGVDEIDGIIVADDEPSPAFIPLSSVGRRDKPETGWVEGPPVAEVSDGQMVRFDVTVRGIDESFVITNVDNRIAAFRNACAHQGMTLDGGMIDDGVIICPWHGFKFEATTGECISAPGAQLEQLPTRVDDGHVWVRAMS